MGYRRRANAAFRWAASMMSLVTNVSLGLAQRSRGRRLACLDLYHSPINGHAVEGIKEQLAGIFQRIPSLRPSTHVLYLRAEQESPDVQFALKSFSCRRLGSPRHGAGTHLTRQPQLTSEFARK